MNLAALLLPIAACLSDFLAFREGMQNAFGIEAAHFIHRVLSAHPVIPAAPEDSHRFFLSNAEFQKSLKKLSQSLSKSVPAASPSLATVAPKEKYRLVYKRLYAELALFYFLRLVKKEGYIQSVRRDFFLVAFSRKYPKSKDLLILIDWLRAIRRKKGVAAPSRSVLNGTFLPQ